MSHDAILIAGGGLRPDGSLLEWIAPRFDRALELHSGDEPIVCLSGGTTHKPNPVDPAGFPISEAAAGARYLMARGVKAGQIVLESLSLDTVGNAFFARLLHTDPRGWRKLLLVTSAFHMPRFEAISRHVFSLAPKQNYELMFEAVSDDRLSPADLAFRCQREAESLERFRSIAAEITNIEQMHRFVFEKHQAYAAQPAGAAREQSAGLSRVY